MLGLAAGKRFGVVGLRGAGAHAAVYDAWDATRAEACVLKIVRSERHALGHVHDLLLREERLMSAASVAPKPRGVGKHDPEPTFAFLAMDEAPGLPITAATAPVALRSRGAIESVADLHRAGLFHGDLKPAHLLFAEGRVELLDFGAAAFANDVAQASRQTTPAYAAPEREVSGPSAASDVYSLGCVLFELASGKRPFADLSGAALVNARANQPVSCDCVSPALRAVVRAALEKHAGGRPSAAELLAAVC